MREQEPGRARSEFRRGGLRLRQARKRCVEAERCLMCPEQPCIAGCPVGIDIPGFIQKISEKDYRGAYDVITDDQPAAGHLRARLPAGDSVRGRVHRRRLRWSRSRSAGWSASSATWRSREGWANVPYIEPNGFRIGIVGSGPAGMACAADMAKAGCEVTVYEAFHQPGGVLRYGIPDFRLPNEVIDAEIEQPARSSACTSSATRWSGACSPSSR